ncbi:hypothetical protein EDD15DRAFT_1399001 [Pisolithus albus]|nr:hypothetical protein EDD15DRAFT_1399001 [Pisolithus albus]
MRSSSIDHSPLPVPEPVIVESPVIPEHSSSANAHIVSNARGPYPQLEMFEVPRHSLTVGHTGRHHIHAETREQALNRIMRKLSDMGFTLGSHPNLRQKVTEQLMLNIFSCLTPHIPGRISCTGPCYGLPPVAGVCMYPPALCVG